MKLHTYLLFLFFSLLFVFYPGDSLYFSTFAFNRQLLSKGTSPTNLHTLPIPVVKNQLINPDLTAEGAYIVDAPSFTPVYERNSKSEFFPASTTKIVTALVAADVFDLDKVVIIRRAVSEGQTMGLVVGEKITVENLLYGTLVHSGNDAAYALADAYGYDGFVNLMNKKAESLHMTHTHFKNPAGLDNVEQITTPFDLALAARELLKNKLLSKIVSTRDITVSDNDFIYFHRLSNVNKLLGEVHGIGGLKTGYTESAGENLVSLYKKNDHEFIIVILRSKDRFADTKAAVKWIDENVDYSVL